LGSDDERYWSLSSRNELANTHDDNFIMIRPPTMEMAATIRMGLADSPKRMIPTRNAPTAPIPVQMV